MTKDQQKRLKVLNNRLRILLDDRQIGSWGWGISFKEYIKEFSEIASEPGIITTARGGITP